LWSDTGAGLIMMIFSIPLAWFPHSAKNTYRKIRFERLPCQLYTTGMPKESIAGSMCPYSMNTQAFR
jgi:hypothetical protein